MTLEEMQDRLNLLSGDLGCRLDQAPNIPGMMYVEFGYVEGPTMEEGQQDRASYGSYPNAQSRYLTCLHELGHFNYGHAQGRPMNEHYASKAFGYALDPEYYVEDDNWYFNNGVLNSEAEAWNYALDECKIPSNEIAPETRNFMWDTCLGSYFRSAQQVGFETPGQRLYNGDRAYTAFAYGKPDNYFFETKRRILEGDRPKEKGMKKTLNIPQELNIEWIPEPTYSFGGPTERTLTMEDYRRLVSLGTTSNNSSR